MKVNLEEFIMKETGGLGADTVFEASGSPQVYPGFFKAVRRGGKAVLVGMMNGTVQLDVPLIQVRGISIEPIFRYMNAFGSAVALVSAGKIDVKRLISKTFKFEDSIAAYDFAASARNDVIKVMIELD